MDPLSLAMIGSTVFSTIFGVSARRRRAKEEKRVALEQASNDRNNARLEEENVVDKYRMTSYAQDYYNSDLRARMASSNVSGGTPMFNLSQSMDFAQKERQSILYGGGYAAGNWLRNSMQSERQARAATREGNMDMMSTIVTGATKAVKQWRSMQKDDEDIYRKHRRKLGTGLY